MEHEYRNLKIWEKARTLCNEVYMHTKQFPKQERYSLVNQMRRCSVSIASNISEGSGAGTDDNFKRYLNISTASICELETQLYISYDLKYISAEKLEMTISKTDELKRMIISFKKSLK